MLAIILASQQMQEIYHRIHYLLIHQTAITPSKVHHPVKRLAVPALPMLTRTERATIWVYMADPMLLLSGHIHKALR